MSSERMSLLQCQKHPELWQDLAAVLWRGARAAQELQGTFLLLALLLLVWQVPELLLALICLAVFYKVCLMLNLCSIRATNSPSQLHPALLTPGDGDAEPSVLPLLPPQEGWKPCSFWPSKAVQDS